MNNLYNNTLLLIDVDAAGASADGTAKTLIPSDDPSGQASWLVVFNVTQTGSGTADANMESSWDGGTTWYPTAAMTQRTSAGTSLATVAATNLGPKVRGRLIAGGGATIHGEIRLACDEQFSVQ